MRIAELDASRLGERLIMLPVIAAQLGHAAPRHSTTYLSVAGEAEIEFLVDLIGGLSTEAMAGKWYGGSDRIREFVRRLPAPEASE
jgi:hypothetical protein